MDADNSHRCIRGKTCDKVQRRNMSPPGWHFSSCTNVTFTVKQYNGVFPKCFTEFSDKNICHYSKRARTCCLLHKRWGCYHSASKTHVETGSLNWAQFMLQWFSDFLNSLNSVKVLLYLRKTPLWPAYKTIKRLQFCVNTTFSMANVTLGQFPKFWKVSLSSRDIKGGGDTPTLLFCKRICLHSNLTFLQKNLFAGMQKPRVQAFTNAWASWWNFHYVLLIVTHPWVLNCSQLPFCKTRVRLGKLNTNQRHCYADYCHFIGGSKGAPGMCLPSLSVQFLSFPYSFRRKSCQIIGLYPKLRGWRPPPSLRNLGSATTVDFIWTSREHIRLRAITAAIKWRKVLHLS